MNPNLAQKILHLHRFVPTMAAPRGDPPPPPPPSYGDIYVDGGGIDHQTTRAYQRRYLSTLNINPTRFFRKLFGRSSTSAEDISADNLNPLILLTEGQRLQTENDQLQTQIGSLNEKIAMMEGEIAGLNAEIDLFKETQHDEDFVLAQSQIAELRRNHELVLSRMQSIHQNTLLQKNADYKSLFEKYENQLSQLHKTTSELDRVSPLFFEAREENGILQFHNEMLREENNRLQKNLFRSRNNMSALEKTMKNLEALVKAHLNKVILIFPIICFLDFCKNTQKIIFDHC